MKQLSENARVVALGMTALLLGALFVALFFGKTPGLNFPLFIIASVLGGLLLAYEYRRPLGKSHYAVIGSALFFSTMLFVRSSDPLAFFNVCATVLLLFIAVELTVGKRLRAFLVGDYIKAAFLPLRFIAPFFETFPAVISFRNISGEGGRTKEIVRGSSMAIIAVIVFAALLSSADAGFDKLLANVFSFDIDEDTFGRLILGAFTTAFFIGAFGYMFRRLHPAPAPEAPAAVRSLGLLETTILFGAINALFAAFVILQISYLFGGAAHLIAADLTYAEYAREGFTQLIWVAVLSFLVIAFAERQIVQHEGVHSRRFKLLSGTLVLLVIAILVSAFSRLSLYEDAYGFTVIRLYSHALMIWLGVALAMQSLHIAKSGKRSEFALRLFTSALLFLFMMNLLSPDAFIAKRNIERYTATGKVDAQYLGSLSNDAVPYTIGLLNDPRAEVREDFKKGRSWHERNRPNSWEEYRLGDNEADRLLAPYRPLAVEDQGWYQGEIEE
jgi:hypothetical protein